MAEIVKSMIPFAQAQAPLVFTQATGDDYLTLDNADGRVTLFVRNGNAQDAVVTLKAGDGDLAALGDLSITAGGSQTVAVPFSRVESARVKVISGADKGKVFVSSSAGSGGSLSGVSFAVLSVE